MSHQPFKIGDSVDVQLDRTVIPGEVAAFRLAGTRQILTVKGADGQTHTIVVDLAQYRETGAAIVAGPVEIAGARALALSVLSGRQARLPATAEANILAAAVVALTEPPAEVAS